MEPLKKFIVDLKDKFFSLSPSKRLIFMAVGVGGVCALGLLITVTTKANYGVLFSNLTQNDAGAIVAKLKAQKIPYEIKAGGTTLMVPESQVYDLRLSLASEGLPRGGGVGFELFDKQALGTTEFVQKLNYQRALQGELARTIRGFPEIEEARVHIVTPKDSLFIEKQKKASAAVVLKLRRGRSLSPAQLEGIVNLVASSVAGLQTGQVTVVDMTGKILSKPQDPLGSGGLTNAQMEYQHQLEEGLRGKVQSMLAKILGPNKSIVQVAADIDFQREDVTEDHYSPDQKLIRSEQRTSERKTLGSSAMGIPERRYDLNRGTVTSNAPGKGPPPLTAPPSTPKSKGRNGELERKSEILNYEINHVNRQIIKYPGKLRRLSVAVVVDGLYNQSAKKRDGTPQFINRSPEEMRNLASTIKKAVGFNQDRGDQFAISCIPLAPQFEEGGMALPLEKSWSAMFIESAKIGLIVLLVLVVLMFLLRRKRPQKVPPALEPPPIQELPQTLGAIEGSLPSPAAVSEPVRPTRPIITLPGEGEDKQKIAQFLTQNPERTVEVLRLWLYEKDRKQ